MSFQSVSSTVLQRPPSRALSVTFMHSILAAHRTLSCPKLVQTDISSTPSRISRSCEHSPADYRNGGFHFIFHYRYQELGQTPQSYQGYKAERLANLVAERLLRRGGRWRQTAEVAHAIDFDESVPFGVLDTFVDSAESVQRVHIAEAVDSTALPECMRLRATSCPARGRR